ncbi:MAG TPA: PAS domain S-box protein [Verrucomicrobiae bacterium]|nr:PAS domain S-box protein [Verrucomicrobiae bacterium]
MSWHSTNRKKPGRKAWLTSVGSVLLAAALTAAGGVFLLQAVRSASRSGVHGFEQTMPVLGGLGALLGVFALLLTMVWFLLREVRLLRSQQEELTTLAMVANKTDHAVFLTNAEGYIQWVNEGFTRVTGHLLVDAMSKQPAAVLLGALQNINVTQKIREGISQHKIFTVEALCSHRRGHRYWVSLTMTPVFDEQKQLVHYIGVASDITARKRAEEEVGRIGRRSELFLNAAGDGIFGLDLQGAITFVNSAAARLTRWEAPELIGQPVSCLLHQLRVQRSAAAQDELFTGAAFIDGTVQIGDTDEFKTRDSKPFPVEYTSTPVHEGSSLIGSVVVFRDITDRRESEELRSRQARQYALRADVAFGLTNGDNLRNVLHRAMQCIVKHLDGAFARVWTLNAEENMLELQASAGIYTHTDGPHGRIPVGTFKVGKIAQERAPQLSTNLVTDPDVIDKDWVLRERMAAFVGFPLFVEGRLVGVIAMYSRNKLPSDALELMGCVADTVAQGIVRKQAEEKVAQQAALLDKSQDAIAVIDLNQRCIYWNKSAERLYGWENVNVYGQNFEELVFRDRAYFERARAYTLQKGEWHDGGCLIHRGQETLTVESRWTLITDDLNRPRSILIINTDVSDKKRIEAQFLRTQRMESIGTLAGGIAHDLNNVLAPIMMSVEILKTKFNDDHSQRMLAILENSAKRGADMVKQVLTFARGVEGERVLLQPRHLLQDITKMIRDTFPKTIQFKSKIPDDLWPITGDATQLHQVLVNLTVNARDAMPEGGTLTVTAENFTLDSDIQHNGNMILPGYFVLVKVTDTGTGISPEVLDKIFDPFFTTKEPGKGTGLGLSTVLGIVKSHGGFVQVQTELNKGTTFLVHLPAQEGAQMLPVDAEPREMPVGHGELLLAVDDESAVLTMTKETLEAFGYRVLTARDGAEAIALFTAHRNDIRTVLTDMLMPHMDGPSTIRVLKKLDPSVKVIAASGLMDSEKVKDATGLEKIAFLMKPYTAEKLLTTVHRVLAEAA